MKHWKIYLAAGAAVILAGALPFQNQDIGKLQPVETALIWMERDAICMTTDTGDSGLGNTWQQTRKNLEDTAPGAVFYGTGSFLLIDESAQGLLPVLAEDDTFSPTCALCLVQAEEIDLETVGKYLSAHQPAYTLRSLRAALQADEPVQLPRLTQAGGRYLLVPEED